MSTGFRQFGLFFCTWLFALFAWLGVDAPPAQADLTSSCVLWPTAAPVWDVCWKSPTVSSGIDGSGLELTRVYYKGKSVLGGASLPVLNVKYDPGGCGGSTLSYRDWAYQLQAFQANNVLQPGYAEPTTPPRTVCDQPGTDVGTFAGVAVEKQSGQLVLTTQMRAGWYRYIQKWTFLADGTIQPRLGFTAVQDPCVNKPHTHHAYWRFDFDVNAGSPNSVYEWRNGWTPISTEAKRLKEPAVYKYWGVYNPTTQLGYVISPPNTDAASDAYGIADLWALQYADGQEDDGGAIAGDNRAQLDRYINGQSTSGTDVVLWYHAQVRHASGYGCEFTGPTLKPFGTW